MEGFSAPGLYAPATLPKSFVGVQVVQTLRLANAGYTTAPTDDPADTLYLPRILGDVEVSQSAVDALGIGGRIALGIAEIALHNEQQELDGPVYSGTADGRRAVVRVLPVVDAQASNYGSALGSSAIAFQGIVQRVEATDYSRARIAITDASERLAVPLQTNRYTGAGGLEGPSTLGGRPKPIALGANFNVAPVALGNVDLGDGSLPTFAVNWRAVEDIFAVRVRGIAQSEVTGTAPTVGEYRQWASDGVFQIGSDPDGAVTADVQGDNVGGYVASTAGIVRRLIQSLGPIMADSELNTQSLGFAETDLPGNIGWYRGADETTAGDAIDEIVAGCGAIFCGGRDGRVRLVDPLAAGTAQFALSAGLILEIEPLPLPAAMRPLPRTVAIDWRPNGAPTTDFAGSVTDADRAQLSAAASGPVRETSVGITARVAQGRDLRLPGRYYAEADAETRAAQWLSFLEGAPRLFRVVTDRYRGAIELGDLGAIAYPAHGLDAGRGVVVLGYAEALSAQRVSLIVATVPWVTIPPLVTGGDGLDYFILDTDELA